MNYYLISDTHFGHENLVKWGKREKDFESKILEGLKTIKDDKYYLIHLGDVCMGRDDYYNTLFTKTNPLSRMIGKILIKGNHDNKSNLWYYERGWDLACKQIRFNMFGKDIILSHRPVETKEGEVNIHGHTHGNDHREGEYKEFYNERNIDISPEIVGYDPIKLNYNLVNL